MTKALDLTGQKFGRLTATHPTEKRSQGRVVWHCECECGNTIEVASHSLVSGNTKSCGCLKKETESPRPKEDEAIFVYANWCKMVLIKDDHTCQRCGLHDINAQYVAHHVDSCDNFPRFRTRLDNGVTLCKDCDDDFHHEYGRKNNTRRQFERWIRQCHKET